MVIACADISNRSGRYVFHRFYGVEIRTAAAGLKICVVSDRIQRVVRSQKNGVRRISDVAALRGGDFLTDTGSGALPVRMPHCPYSLAPHA